MYGTELWIGGGTGGDNRLNLYNMSAEHLTYFKVENFKRFDSLELTDIGQFNLIVGDNNVGKTSLLEALLFSENPAMLFQTFHKLLIDRGVSVNPTYTYGSAGQIDQVIKPKEIFLKYIFNNLKESLRFTFLIEKQKDPHFISLSYKDSMDLPQEKFDQFSSDGFFSGMGFHFESDKRYIETQRNELIGLDIYRFFNPDVYFLDLPLLTTNMQVDKNLADSYFKIIGTSRQANKNLVQNLKHLVPKIETIEARRIDNTDHVMLGLEGADEYQPINIFGEGTIIFTNILLQVLKYRGKRLMIDEIDTGIHYSRMKNFLKTVFQVAQENDVQLFMTTHSLECQQAFAEVFEDEDMKGHQEKVRQFTLIEKPDGQVKAINRNFDQLEFALQTDNETRGGR